MKVELEWKEPPPAPDRQRGARNAKKEAVELLKKHPGRWALVQKGMSSSGVGTVWRKLGVEVEVRGAPDENGRRRYDVYARWVEPDWDDLQRNQPEIPKGSREEQEHVGGLISEDDVVLEVIRDEAAPGRPGPKEHAPARKQWTINGKVRTDPPPVPLPVPEGETPGEARARRTADRIAMDRWKRGVPVDGSPKPLGAARG